MNLIISKYLASRGYEIVDTMSSHIQRFKSWYKGNVEGFHNYSIFNGAREIGVRRRTLQLGKIISEDIADYLFNEKCGVVIEDDTTREFVETVFDKNLLRFKLNEYQEKKAALGTVVYIPYYTAQGIKINFATAENIAPLSWENGIISELCVFSKAIEVGKEYWFLQLFLCDEEGYYTIENVLLRDNDDGNYTTIDLDTIAQYQDVEKMIETNSQIKPFVVDRLNKANNIDLDSPYGIALFANALDAMEVCDVIFDSYFNEFNLGKKRVMVAPEAMNTQTGKPVFDPNDLTFYLLPTAYDNDKSSRPYIQEIQMDIRSEEHIKSLQNALNVFSILCGFDADYYIFDGRTIATATQVISTESNTFRTIKKHEALLEIVLKDLVKAIISVGERNGYPGLDIETEIKIQFDDSIFEDTGTEIKYKMAEVSAGILDPVYYLAWRYNLTYEQAQKLLPNQGLGVDEMQEEL